MPEFVTTDQPAEGDANSEESQPKSAGRNPRELLDHLRVSRDGEGDSPTKVSNEQNSSGNNAGKKRGRPRLFDDLARAKLLGLITAGVSQRTAATYLGIDHSTISKAIARDEEFARDVDQAQAAARVHPMLKILAAAEKSFTAAKYVYENFRPTTDLSEARAAKAAARAQEAAAQARAEREAEDLRRTEAFLNLGRSAKD